MPPFCIIITVTRKGFPELVIQEMTKYFLLGEEDWREGRTYNDLEKLNKQERNSQKLHSAIKEA